MRILREGEKEMRKQCEKFGKSHKEVYWYFASKSSAYDSMPMFPAKNLKVSNKIPPSDTGIPNFQMARFTSMYVCTVTTYSEW